MKIVTGLFGYAVGVAGLVGALIYGMSWLVQPDASAAASAPRVAPVPPRIAESIERRKEPPPPPPPAVAPKEPMTVSNASLAPPPNQTIRELSAPKPPIRAPGPRSMQARTAAPPQSAQPAVPAATTARTDAPF